MKASFVIPCFRSTKSLIRLVEDIEEIFRNRQIEFEVILILDSRDDGTLQLANHLLRSFPEVQVKRLSRNFGQQQATAAGISASRGQIVLTMDDDYQHRPEDALKMLDLLDSDHEIDLVYGRPTLATSSRSRDLSGILYRKAMRFVGLEFAESMSAFRAFRGNFRDVFGKDSSPNTPVDITLSWVVANVVIHRCKFYPREEGQTGYSRKMLVKLALRALTTYTVKPLYLGLYLGLFGIVASAVVAVTVTVLRLWGGIDFPGFASTTLLILGVGSLQLFLLGIIGIYVGRQHERGLARPSFFILEEVKAQAFPLKESP